jgi:hypothetical protein
MSDRDLFGNELPAQPEPETFHLRDGSSIDESGLQDANEKIQSDAMRSWFYANYQDPAQSNPYDSEEGGYVYLYGGPYNAHEELISRFEGIVPDEAVERIANELSNEAWEWEGRDRGDDYVLDTIAPPSEHIERFSASIANIRKLLNTPVDPTEEQCFRRMIFANIITTLETYLSDRFVSSITSNPKALRNFVETYPRFKKEAIKLSDIFKKSDNLELQVKSMLLSEVVWHRLVNVGKMFTDTFGLDFPEPENHKDLLRAIDIRHDLVHRSGKTKNGIEHTITPEGIEQIIVKADALVSWIDEQNDKFNVEEVKEFKDSEEDLNF